MVRAWDTTEEIEAADAAESQTVWRGKKRIIVAPAMNMENPITKRQIKVLEEDWGVCDENADLGGEGWLEVLRPQEKELACGDVGDGAMKDWKEIVKVIEQRLNLET